MDLERRGAAVSLFTAFGYFADDAENERPVAEVARILSYNFV